MITVVDYGVGNIGALVNMFDYLGIDCRVSESANEIAKALKLVLPGVGSFDRAMTNLRDKALVEPLAEAVQHRLTPILGVCLGMQLFARRSEEGTQDGLGWVEADVRLIETPANSGLKVPHIGWANARPLRPTPIFPSLESLERFYFVHSYYMSCDRREDMAAVIDYGSPLCCAISVGNVHGVQFHPEKSHRFGMRILKSFASL